MSMSTVEKAGIARPSLLRVGVIAGNEILNYGIVGLLTNLPEVVAERIEPLRAGPLGLEDSDRFDIVVLACDGLDPQDVERLAREADRGKPALLLMVRTRSDDLLDYVALAPSGGFLAQEHLTRELLAAALRKVSAGARHIPDSIATLLLDNIRSTVAEPPRPAPALTRREEEVLVLLAGGLSNKQIAHRLYLSQHGVKKVVGGLLSKFNSPNRTQVVAMAIRDGVIPTDLIP